MPGVIAPESTSREPNHSTATTEAKMVKMAKKVSTARAQHRGARRLECVLDRPAKRPVTSVSLVKACIVRIAPMCSLA